MGSPSHVSAATSRNEPQKIKRGASGKGDIGDWFLSAQAGDIDLLLKLLDEGAVNLEAENDIAPPHSSIRSLTALGVAATYGQVACVEKLLELGADPEHASQYGETPLMVSTYTADLAVAQALLDGGALVDQVDLEGETALHKATHYSEVKEAERGLEKGAMVRLLLQNQANPTAMTEMGETAVHMGSRRGHIASVKALLSAGGRWGSVGADELDKYGRTPLHNAAMYGEIEMIDFLLNRGADLFRKDKTQRDALGLATHATKRRPKAQLAVDHLKTLIAGQASAEL
jgi:ankyrin repeat protein